MRYKIIILLDNQLVNTYLRQICTFVDAYVNYLPYIRIRICSRPWDVWLPHFGATAKTTPP